MSRPPVSRRSPVEAVLLALLAMVPALFFRGTAEKFEVPKVALLVTGALALAAVWLVAELAALAREGPGRWITGALSRLGALPRQDPLGGAILIYVASAAASTVASPNPRLSVWGAPESTAGLRTAVATAAVYFAARSRPGTPRTFDRIVLAAALGAAAAAGYALVQLAGLDPLTWGRLAVFGGAFRVFGTLGHPNFLGAYLAMMLPLSIDRAMRARSTTVRVAWLALVAGSLVALAATLSRGAWLALVAAAVALLALRPLAAARDEKGKALRPSPTLGRALGVAAAVAAVAGAFLVARPGLGRSLATRVREIASIRAPSTQSRLQIWGAGLRMAADHPVLGVGLDAFAVVFPAYRTADYWRTEWGGTPTKAHNEALHIVATQGAVGGIAALLVILLAAREAWRTLRRGPTATRRLAVPAAAALLAFAVQDLASFTVVSLGVLAAALAGWLAATGVPKGSNDARSRPPPRWAIVVAGGLAVLAMGPLVVRPWRAQAAEQRSRAGASSERARWLTTAESVAPWDARYAARLAQIHLDEARAEPVTGARGARLDQALAAARRAVAIEPQNGSYWTGLGEIQAERARLTGSVAAAAEARGTLGQAIGRDSANAQILDRAGYVLVQLGRYADARALALRSASLYPDLGQPLGLLGAIALEQRRYADGVDTLRLALHRDWRNEIVPRVSAWSNLAAGLLSLGSYREARDAAREALRLDPGHAGAKDNLALAERALETARHFETRRPPGGPSPFRR